LNAIEDLLTTATGVDLMAENHLLRAARREAQELYDELVKIPAFEKWRAAMRVVEIYEAEAKSEPKKPKPGADRSVVNVSVHGVSATGTAAAIAHTTNVPNSVQIQNAGIEFLRQIGRRAKSKEIADAVREKGIEIRGSDYVATVAAHMSNAKAIVDNVRGEGYGLREWTKPNGATH
jgi:hypothetical protein